MYKCLIMKKINYFLIVLVLFVFTDKMNAQLFVSNNSYIYNKGSLVYAKADVNLNAANSNFYLRNEGQLLQGGTVAGGSNQGLGNLSVFQEGTANNFGYNYWCSPVGVPAAAAGNNSFILNQVIKRPISNTAIQTPNFISSFDGVSSNASLDISNRWIYQFAVADNYSAWSYAGATGAIAAGKGFTMKGVSGDDTTAGIGESTDNNPTGAGGLNDYQRYDFRGKPNEGTISIPVAAQVIGTQYPNSTLTGNPYPSAINLNYFLLENSGYNVNYTTGAVTAGGPVNVINGNAYFWEHEKPATSHILVQYIGGYGYYVPNNVNANSPGTYNNATWNTYNLDGSLNVSGGSSGANYKRMFSPVGQGFMVQGLANGNALMKNAYRVFVKEGVANNSQFERNNTTNATVNPQNWDEIPNVAGVDYTQFSKLEVPQIKIHTVINNLFTKEITMAFNPNALDGFDTAFDAKSYESDFPNDANFSVLGSTDNFIITTLPFDIDKRIPFTLKVTDQSTFKVSVGNIINFDGSDNVYIYDGDTGLYHDILNDFYQIALSPGVYANRFEITFKNDALGVDHTIKDNFAIVQNNSNQLLSISNPNTIDVNSVELFDMAGKLIFNKVNLGAKTMYEFPTSSLSDGVYVVRLNTKDNKKLAQKIIVEKAK
jgi:hypothetical protein